MSYQITEECIKCNRCLPICPTGAVTKDETHFGQRVNQEDNPVKNQNIGS